ncbi:TPA: hypothetical protein N0F65_006228 [Lagenidium giganteum]|uniref:Uncharacterized protein n=1 Tax=Lagenidium giganteum TaxID=4803 RepID=A0AAV2Z2N9_9STRA|nr:TPA: hypothetical protein N0F65_006228 [Lagenidium giganteum]
MDASTIGMTQDCRPRFSRSGRRPHRMPSRTRKRSRLTCSRSSTNCVSPTTIFSPFSNRMGQVLTTRSRSKRGSKTRTLRPCHGLPRARTYAPQRTYGVI